MHESYFRFWYLSERPKWTNLFFSNESWDTFKFGDVLDKFEAAFIRSISSSSWDFKFQLTNNIYSCLRDCLAEDKRDYIIKLFLLLVAHLEYLSPF